ncbi:ferredoxin reductase family protein [Pseudofrankia sp. BMG5.37]|uniref:ferredoxin reductase family protein n=1 Tax=Pseudofrankia sp. BMG5.37 TaxID=3050035 RepID=UPI002897CF1B|nr:ferredoxin reductase family protein [Pseudofrankia sp. BMG5.37]
MPGDEASAADLDPVDSTDVPATMPGYRLEPASVGDGGPVVDLGAVDSTDVPATMPGYRLEPASVGDGGPVVDLGAVDSTDVPATMPGYRLELALPAEMMPSPGSWSDPSRGTAAVDNARDDNARDTDGGRDAGAGEDAPDAGGAGDAERAGGGVPRRAVAEAAPSAGGRSVGRASGPRSSRSAGWRGRLAVRAGLVAWGVLVVGLWWLGTPATSLRGGAAVMTSFGRVCGLLAAYLMLVELLLMARIPVLERAVGLGRLAAWHRGLGTNIVLLMVLHVLLTVWGYGLADHRQPVSELFTVITTYPEMWKATIGVLLFVTVGVASARTLRPRISYEVWYLLHLTSYAAVLLVYGHQVSTGAEFVGHPVNQRLWRAMYVAVFACLVIGRLVLPLVATARHRLRVERVVEEAPGIVSVWIRGRNVDRLGARPGQFLRWRFLAPGHWLSAHPYSLSAPPRPDRLRITVKAAGDHSRAMAGLRPGTFVVADGPFGLFTAERATRGKSLLVAGGGGIGPIRALAEELANRGDDVVVIHRVRKAHDLALWRELRTIASRHRLTVHSMVGSRRELGYDPMTADLLAGSVPDVIERDVFICGPTGLTHGLVRSLRALGLADDQIHTEDFSLRDARVGERNGGRELNEDATRREVAVPPAGPQRPGADAAT